MTQKYSLPKSERGFLLDTHIFIWWMEKSKSLPKEIFDLLNNPENDVFLSVVNIWEIVIKRAKKQLKTPPDLESAVKRSRFVVLPVEMAHVLGTERLPNYHKDPFDRILISQAKVENLTLISSDEKIWKYRLSLLKA